MPIFTNRENKRIVLPDGDIYYHARSTAVVGCVLCVHNDDVFVLMVERGPAVDNSGKWCMPCGYLDWDEDLAGAVRRELFEETNLDIDALQKEKVLYSNFERPYFIESSPKSHRQNISNHFGIVLKGPFPELPPSLGMRSNEIVQVEWVRLSAIPTNAALAASGVESYFAFDHNDKVHRFIKELKSDATVNEEVLKVLGTLTSVV